MKLVNTLANILAGYTFDTFTPRFMRRFLYKSAELSMNLPWFCGVKRDLESSGWERGWQAHMDHLSECAECRAEVAKVDGQ